MENDTLILRLAFQYNLSAYDAAYLALAIQENAILVTNDKKLASAASTANIRLRTHIGKYMNHIEKLLIELCPDGVEFRELGEVLIRCENIKWTQQGDKEFKYIDLGSVDRARHKITEWTTITQESAPSRAQQIIKTGDVIFGTTRPLLKRYCVISKSFNGQVASTGYCILRANTDFVIPNYIFHIIGTEIFYDFVSDNERGASYPAIPDNVVKQFKIPIPPLAIQQEIVKILDKFVELQAELQAELQKRKIQYEYYRNALLTFPEQSRAEQSRAEQSRAEQSSK